MSEIKWQWILDQAGEFGDDPEKRTATYEDDDYAVRMYRVTPNALRIDIKYKESG